MTPFLIFRTVAHEGDMPRARELLEQTQCEFLSVILDTAAARVDWPIHEQFGSITARDWAHEIRPACPAFRSLSLGASDGIHTSYRFVGIARPRKRVARIRSPSAFLMIGLHTDLVFSMGSIPVLTVSPTRGFSRGGASSHRPPTAASRCWAVIERCGDYSPPSFVPRWCPDHVGFSAKPRNRATTPMVVTAASSHACARLPRTPP